MITDSLIASLEASLEGRGKTRRKLSSILKECGYKQLTEQRAESLQAELERRRLYPRPKLTTFRLPHSTSISITTEAYTPWENNQGLIKTERELEDLLLKVRSSVPQLRKLSLRGRQYRIPGTDLRVDLAFTDRRTGEVVLCELKKDDGGYRTSAQLRTYLNRHKEHQPDVAVRGLLITGASTPDLQKLVDGIRQDGHEVDWFCYELTVKLHQQTRAAEVGSGTAGAAAVI